MSKITGGTGSGRGGRGLARMAPGGGGMSEEKKPFLVGHADEEALTAALIEHGAKRPVPHIRDDKATTEDNADALYDYEKDMVINGKRVAEGLKEAHDLFSRSSDTNTVKTEDREAAHAVKTAIHEGLHAASPARDTWDWRFFEEGYVESKAMGMSKALISEVRNSTYTKAIEESLKFNSGYGANTKAIEWMDKNLGSGLKEKIWSQPNDELRHKAFTPDFMKWATPKLESLGFSKAEINRVKKVAPEFWEQGGHILLEGGAKKSVKRIIPQIERQVQKQQDEWKNG